MSIMATKTTNVYARIEPELKEEAEEILNSLGISASAAINMFYHQIVLQKGLPFKVDLMNRDRKNFDDMNNEEKKSTMARWNDEIRNGKVISFEDLVKSLKENGICVGLTENYENDRNLSKEVDEILKCLD